MGGKNTHPLLRLRRRRDRGGRQGSRRRVLVECTWLEALCAAKGIRECKPLSASERKALRGIAASFSVEDAARVKEIERTTNHDVKAVEYFLKEKVKELQERFIEKNGSVLCRDLLNGYDNADPNRVSKPDTWDKCPMFCADAAELMDELID